MNPHSESEFDRSFVQQRNTSHLEPDVAQAEIAFDTTRDEKSPETFQQHHRHSEDSFLSKFFWVASTAAIVLVVWQIGPQIVENYQYASTRAKVRAEYENAVEMLEKQPLSNVSLAYQLVVQKIRPSVVSIRSKTVSSTTNRRGSHTQFEQGQGSGVIMSDEGYVLTNAHVIRDAQEIEIVLHDRRTYVAQRVGKPDLINDLAVLKINAPDLIPATWGDSDRLDVGSLVWAIGSPYGLDQTVTSGIVSATNRYDSQSPHQQLLQTDAAVNPGNSGGPLVDSEGRVIGINTSIFGEKFQGISFAVPSVIAKFVYEQTIEKGYVARGMLGIAPNPVFQSDVEKYGLPDINGAMVVDVEPNSPAYRAGIRVNDVVRRWNEQEIVNYSSLYRFVDMTQPDTKASVELLRDGQLYEVEITVGSRDEFERRREFQR